MGNQSYQHDAAGNLSDDSLNSYHYNGRNRLVEVKRQGLNVVYYAYNAWGERVSKAVAGSITHFLYDEAGRLLGTYQQTPQGLTPQQELVWLEDTPVAVLVPGATGVQVYRIQPDHLDTPRLVQDSSGKTVWTWPQAEPFGANPPNEDPDGDGVRFTLNLRFPGQHFDTETRLHYNYFRDYAPALGRYVESDPIGLEGGVNTYGYVDGDPLGWVDAVGLASNEASKGACRRSLLQRAADRIRRWGNKKINTVAVYIDPCGCFTIGINRGENHNLTTRVATEARNHPKKYGQPSCAELDCLSRADRRGRLPPEGGGKMGVGDVVPLGKNKPWENGSPKEMCINCEGTTGAFNIEHME